VDGTRYLLLSAGTFGGDVDITMERMVDKYNADLANGIGNLVSRVIKLAQNFQFPISNFQSISNDEIFNLTNKLKLDKALSYIWNIICESNKHIEETKPWELAKNESKKEVVPAKDDTK
jgi:methionyl-tRNA synthetase